MKSAGLAAATQTVYIDAVRRLAAHYRRSPDRLAAPICLAKVANRQAGANARFSISIAQPASPLLGGVYDHSFGSKQNSN
jgi:hypothetical protein